MPAHPRVAVLGGGFQGVCIALELAQRGAHVTIFERKPDLLEGAATAAEGKIHLGYVYAGDTTFQTARTMLQGARVFSPLVSRWLGIRGAEIPVSSDFFYLVHRDSAVSNDDFAAYLTKVADEARATGVSDYFGRNAGEKPRRLNTIEMSGQFGNAIQGAFSTPEIAVDMIALSDLLRRRIADEPRIETRLEFNVDTVDDVRGGFAVRTRVNAENRDEVFDHCVNALWEDRLRLDTARGLMPGRSWVHRYKYGMRFRPAAGPALLQSTTVVHGPFGDSVRFPDGHIYLSWYPACMVGMSSALNPDWPVVSAESEAEIIEKTFRGLSDILPGLSALKVKMSDVRAKAGTIVAWGKTDIDDRRSELHERHDIGVRTIGAYHSVDPGKLTMVPYFAVECADRIMAV